MKDDLFSKVILISIALLLFLNLAFGLFSSGPAVAQQGSSVGRYQISAWASLAGPAGGHHSGYYVVDTATGKVVEAFENTHEKEKEAK